MNVPFERFPQEDGIKGAMPTFWAGDDAVDGTAGNWLAAHIGDIYIRRSAGNVAIYMKTTADGDNGDWQPLTLGTALT